MRKEDAKSLRYVEHVYSVLEKEVLRAMAEKARMGNSISSLPERMKARLALIQSRQDAELEIAKDAYKRKIDELSFTSAKSIFGYIIPSAAALVSVGSSVLELVSNWPVGWKIGATAGLLAVIVKTVSALRKRVARKIKETASEFLENTEKISKNAISLHEAAAKQEENLALQLSQGWNEFVRKAAISCALHCFDIAMDFFPEYVKAELAKITPKDFDFGIKGQRDEAMSLLRKVLEGSGSLGLNLDLNG